MRSKKLGDRFAPGRAGALAVLVISAIVIATYVQPFAASDEVNASSSSTTTVALGDNDAGLGIDAPDDRTEAAKLSDFGTYRAKLKGAEKGDWFRLDIPQEARAPMCVSTAIAIVGDAGVALRLEDAGGAREVAAFTSAARASRIGLAQASPAAAFVGIGGSTGNDRAYDVTLKALRLTDVPGSGDASTSTDAPSLPSSAMAITDACTGGVLGASNGDLADAFKFTGQAGDVDTISVLANTGSLVADLYAPSGVKQATVRAGETLTLTLSESGPWVLLVSDTQAVAPELTTTSSSTWAGDATDVLYLVGLCEPNCGPPTKPCDPMCLMRDA